MGRKFFTILVAMILCLSLAACGQNNQPASQDEDNSTNVIETESPDDVQENDENNELDPGLLEGSYEHHIEDCVFYTENDINQWIDNGVFDFYGMMDYFGFTERIMDEADCCVARTTSDDTYSGIKLSDDMDPFGYSTFVYSTRGGVWVTVIFSDYGEDYLRTKNDNMKVSREMCEMLLYFMEQYDRYGQGDSQPILAMAEFSYVAPEYITIVTKGI